MIKKFIGIGALAFILLTCFACTKPSDKNQTLADAENTLSVDIGSEVPNLDPQLIQDMSSIRVANDLFEGLVTFDQDNRIIPGLAESWEVSPDGVRYTFHLRKGIKFSDGTPITADDVVYSWQRLVNPKTGSPYTLIASSILNASQITANKLPVDSLGVKAINNETVQVTLAYPDADFLAKATRPSLSITPKKVIEKYGLQWINPKYIVTSGAYTLKQHVMNGYIFITKNPYYYDKNKVAIDNIKFYPLVDANTAISKYKAGDLDMTWSVPVDQFKQLEKKYGSQLHITPIEATVYYNINMLRPEFKDIRIRKALSLAIDRDILTKNVIGTGVVPLYLVITPTVDHGKYASIKYSWANDSREEQIAMAKKLYKEAGYGVGHELKTTISYFTNDEQKKVALAIASMWNTILGVNVSVENQDWKTFLQKRIHGDYAISFGRWYADYNGISAYAPIFECNSVVNYTKYCSKNYDNYIMQADYTNNSQLKFDLYNKALNLILNDYPIIPLYQPVSTRLVKPYIAGYIPETNHLDMIKSEWMKKGNN